MEMGKKAIKLLCLSADALSAVVLLSMNPAAPSATIADSQNAGKFMSDDEDVNRIIRYFKAAEEVLALYIFGSFGKGRKTKESDIDVAVLIDESRLKKKGFELLKRKYYAASPTFSMRPVDIVILNIAPPFLKHQVLKTDRILFDRDRKFRVKFIGRAITEYLDYKPIEDIYLKAVARRYMEKSIDR
jgi:predicted nucleotidyltransferase